MKIEICPVCGSPIEHIELTTLPPIPIKQCLACGWRWEGKQEAVEYVTFKDETDIKVKKAIDLLSEKRNLTRKLQEGWKNAEYCPPKGTVGSAELFYNQHKEYADALYLAITALRFMPEAGEAFHIDRSKWTAEWVPMTDDDGCVWLECSACEYDLDSLEEPHPFCPSCGRAMMPEAWAELERRLRG